MGQSREQAKAKRERNWEWEWVKERVNERERNRERLIDQERKRKEEKRRESEVESNGREIWYFEEIRGHEATPSPWHTHRGRESSASITHFKALSLCHHNETPFSSGRVWETHKCIYACTHTPTHSRTHAQSLIFCTVSLVKQGGARKLFEHNSTLSLKDVDRKEGGKEEG